MRARASASRGTTHGDTDVAKDLPKNGPSGWYSQAWMSRALQSLTTNSPKTQRSKSAVPTAVPGSVAAPTRNPISASMSSRTLGPNSIRPSPPRRWPHGRLIGAPETSTVPALP